jgi:small subunit ribosomal protein S8e
VLFPCVCCLVCSACWYWTVGETVWIGVEVLTVDDGLASPVSMVLLFFFTLILPSTKSADFVVQQILCWKNPLVVDLDLFCLFCYFGLLARIVSSSLSLSLSLPTGISRDSRHKRRATGGRKANLKKKRLYESGRPAAMTKLGQTRIHTMRVRGGNSKFRALRLNTGNFSWGTEVTTRQCNIVDVVYNASNNELVRTKTLVKNAIIQVEAAPFKAWYEQHYGCKIGVKKANKKTEEEAKKVSNHVQRKVGDRQKTRTLDHALDEQFASGKLLACISSRPGQSGRCDGYILEGKELEFYSKKLKSKK